MVMSPVSVAVLNGVGVPVVLNVWEFLEYLSREGKSVINLTAEGLAEDDG